MVPGSWVGTLLNAIPPEKEQWDEPWLSCLMPWNVELIRQSNWLNICSSFIIILRWALSLCMPGMPSCLLAFLIEAHCGVYISTDFNCTEIQVISFQVKYSTFFFFLTFVWTCFEGRGWKSWCVQEGEVLPMAWMKALWNHVNRKHPDRVQCWAVIAEGEAEKEKTRVASVSKCITTFMAFHQLIFEQKDLPSWAHLQCLVFPFEFITWM